MSRDYDCLVKILLIGDSGVGKSSIMKQFTDEEYHDEYACTIGVDYKSIPITVKNKLVKLQIWDTAGQERFKTITQIYYRGAHAILVVFDLTDPLSFSNIKGWLSEIDKSAPDNVIKILVGNKADMKINRQISKEEAETFSLMSGFKKYFETSAKCNIGIEQIFLTVGHCIVEKFESNKTNTLNHSIQLTKTKTKSNLDSGPYSNISIGSSSNKKNMTKCNCG